MLVATPSNSGLADRKPKVISGLKKSHIQRSPSLDGLPRLSGILYHYSELDEAWHLRWAVVRDGSLLVYSPDKDPRSQGCSTLGRIDRLQNCDKYFPVVTDNAMQSLDSSVVRNGSHIMNEELLEDKKLPKSTDDTDTLMCSTRSRKNLDQLLRRDQAIFDSALTPFGTNSLGRHGGASCARLPLRHLNLRPCDRRPLSFSLSRRVEDGQPCTVATFQAPSRRDYERWVKTLAVEILRQTPLDAVRFLDILGIAAFEEEKTIQGSRNGSNERLNFTDHTPLRPARMSRKAMFSKGDVSATKRPETPKKPTFKANPFDRSKNGSIKKHRCYNSPKRDRSKNNSSFRKKEKVEEKKPPPVNGIASFKNVARNIFNEKSRMPLLTCQSTVNQDNVTTVTIMEAKDVRGREVFTPPHTIEREAVDIQADEGIVVEISDDDFSSEGDGKTRRLSEHSNCLDSPKSGTSHSSFGDSTLSADCVDGFDDRMLKINIPHAVSISKRKKDEINSLRSDYESNKRRSEIQRKEQNVESNNTNNINPDSYDNSYWGASKPLPPWASRILKPAGIGQLLAKDRSEPPAVVQRIGKSPQIFSGEWSWENSAIYNQINPPDSLFLRARSCSPNKKASSVPRRYASSCSRHGRFSTGHMSLSYDGGQEMVQRLKIRCQSTDKYVPVKEKLALFETLSQMERRLARSSDDLLNKISSDSLPNIGKRAQSLHDLTKTDIPSVPVKEMCKFFEQMSKDRLKSSSLPTKTTVKQRRGEFCTLTSFHLNESKSFDSFHNTRDTVSYLKPNIEKVINFSKKKDVNENYDRLDYIMCRQIKDGNKIISFV